MENDERELLVTPQKKPGLLANKWRVIFLLILVVFITAIIASFITWQLNLVSEAEQGNFPPVDRFPSMKNFCGSVGRITSQEYLQFQQTLAETLIQNNLDAYITEPGANMRYLSGVSWSLSERPFLMITFANASVVWICPAFEERKANELIGGNGKIMTWNEEVSPYLTAGQALGIYPPQNTTISVAIDDEVRYFIGYGLLTNLQSYGLNLVNGKQFIINQRMQKTQHELDILDCANRATKHAISLVIPLINEGIAQSEVKYFLQEALFAGGFTNIWYLVLFGPDASFPHGTSQDRRLERNQLILIDTGGDLYNYQSDISRTLTIDFDAMSQKQKDIWNLVKQAQTAALNTIRPGVSCLAVEDAARQVIINGGYGPDYQYFSHRLGHGIGIQGHEEPYLVRNNTMILQPGMTFSVEPGIYIPNELGVRLEDIVVVTETGYSVFGPLSESLQKPVE